MRAALQGIVPTQKVWGMTCLLDMHTEEWANFNILIEFGFVIGEKFNVISSKYLNIQDKQVNYIRIIKLCCIYRSGGIDIQLADRTG